MESIAPPAPTPVPALTLRTHCYCQPPASFEMAPCSCGNHDTQWSEFEKHLWCSVCEKDFIPKHAGVFDGPIMLELAGVLGISFDRFNLVTKEVERFNRETCSYPDEEAQAALEADTDAQSPPAA